MRQITKVDTFIKIYRNIIGWRWYKNTNTFCLFVHLLLIANVRDSKFEGEVIKRGQVVASRCTLSEETGLSEQSVRTAIKNLKSTGEITSRSTSKFTIFTISNYDEYQKNPHASTSNQPATNQRSTSNQPQYKNIKNNKKEKKEKKEAANSVVPLWAELGFASEEAHKKHIEELRK